MVATWWVLQLWGKWVLVASPSHNTYFSLTWQLLATATPREQVVYVLDVKLRPAYVVTQEDQIETIQALLLHLARTSM